MIKTEIKKEKENHYSFPKLMINEKETLLVLMLREHANGIGEGLVLWQDWNKIFSSELREGEIATELKIKHFKDYHGEITMKNLY